MKKNKIKLQLTIKPEIHDQIIKEAKRLDRHISWVIQYAWRYGYVNLKKIPDMSDS